MSLVDALVDTSVAVPLVVGDHAAHEEARLAVGSRRLGLAGHAAFETYSVLTRLPPPARRSPTVVEQILARRFPANRFLDAASVESLFGRLASLGVAGGGVYDALVGETARNHRLPLLTRDRRAAEVYRRLGVDVELLD